MSDNPVQSVSGNVVLPSPRERSERVSKALSEAARRLRFSSAKQALHPGSFRSRRQRLTQRLIIQGSLLAFVIVPTLAASIYFGLVASDQYAVEARFAVRSGPLAGVDALTALTGIKSIQIIQDTQVVTSFASSRAMLEELDRKAQFRQRYGSESVDYFSRLDPTEPIEKIVKYWGKMFAASIEMPGGIVRLVVKAFRPEDAVAVANAMVDASEELVNRMNDRAREDALHKARENLDFAAARLAEVRAALEVARNREGMIDTKGEEQKTDTLLTQIRSRLLELRQQYDSQIRSLAAEAPSMRSLRANIDALDRQRERIQAELTAKGNEVAGTSILSGSITRLSKLELDKRVAEQQYTHAASALEAARLSSTKKQIYLTSFVRPLLPEEPRFPRRVWSISLVISGGMLVWIVFLSLYRVFRSNLS